MSDAPETTELEAIDLMSKFTLEQWEAVYTIRRILRDPDGLTRLLTSSIDVFGDDYIYIDEAVRGLTANGFDDDADKLNQHWRDILATKPSYPALVALAAYMTGDLELQDFEFLKQLAHQFQEQLNDGPLHATTHHMVVLQLGPTPAYQLKLFTDHLVADDRAADKA